jgi:protocatechuate 3,4-dioxygenase alpha subunit
VNERTPSQTIGPFFAVGLPWSDGPNVVPAGTSGAFWVRGRVLDGAGDAVPDALVETWQADPNGGLGRRDDPPPTVAGFRGFARSATDEAGRFAIFTVMPGVVQSAGGTPQAPHLDVSIFARGLLKRVVTRIYFAEKDGNDRDPVLSSVRDVAARDTLVADRTDDGYRFDIRLQGERETVFFDV